VGGPARERNAVVPVLDEVVRDVRQHAVLRIDELAVDVDEEDRAVLLLARALQLVTDVAQNGGLASTLGAMNQHVRCALAFESTNEELRDLVDLILAMRED